MISRIIGLPADRFDDFKDWTNDIDAFVGFAHGDPIVLARAAASASREAASFLQQLIDDRRRSPAAKRDPRAFPEPDTLNPARQGNRPVTFGYGPQFRIGASLTRMIAEEFFRCILRESRSLQMAGQMEWRPYRLFRGLTALMVHVAASPPRESRSRGGLV